MQFKGTDKYIASDDLSTIVNVAASLERPLLIRGEPGTGKTLLAKAVSESLNLEMFNWHVKSTSKAQDGLYVYDTVQRLNDSRFGGGDVDNIEHYIKLGPLGQAFEKQEKSIVLIDEIDKADVEFPNDLLHELDAMSFLVNETGRTLKANKRPIIIITSNAEKELPDAFLRRCIFHYITFPDRAQMQKIVNVHFEALDDNLMNAALDQFYLLRSRPDIRKKPSTSELVDWISALIQGGLNANDLKDKVPFLGVLLKRESDIEAAGRPVNQKFRY